MTKTTKTPKATKAKASKLDTVTANLIKSAQAKSEARRIAMLSTDAGVNQMLRKTDAKILSAIVAKIAEVTEKPVFTGYTYTTNVETIVAIAQALQFMKGDLREQIPAVYWAVFDADTRTEILASYGRTPYLADELTIEINGDSIIVDPEAKSRAKTGIKPNVPELTVLVNTVAMDLDLLAEYSCTQEQADNAWTQATTKIVKAELLDTYKDALVK